MNYTFLDATGATKTAASSTISSVEYPIVKVPDVVNIAGSVILAGTGSISGTVNIGAMPGSVLAFQGGTQISSISGNVVIQSIVGTFTDGTSRTAAGDPGLYVLGYRNDTMASIVSADKKYTPFGIGQAGEVMTANAPLTQWVQGVASCFTGVIQPVIAAQGASVFTYITSGQVANNSANNAYLTISSGGTNIAYLPVPANSGALPIMPNGWKGLANAAISASVSGVASVFLSFQGFISKT